MKLDQYTPGFVTLQNGYVLRGDTIVAVRPLNATYAGGKEYPPRIAVDFQLDDRVGTNSCVLDCESEAQRDNWTVTIMQQVKAAREALNKARSDNELFALAVVVQSEIGQREWANEGRRLSGQAPAYGGDAPWPHLDRLTAELQRRGIVGP